jgi:5-methylphenazine-1-carboxylate 1-monooxygenase
MGRRRLPLARVLARELAVRPSIEEAIAAYDAQRRPQTAEVVLANRQGGPERCIDIVEARAPDGFVKLDDVISREELEEISRRYKRTAGFYPEILNTRPSLTVRPHRLSRRDRRAREGSPSWT